MLVILSAGLILISSGALLIVPSWGIVLALMSKPVIDATWDFDVGEGSLLYIIGVAVPLLLLPRILRREFRLPRYRSIQLIAAVYLLSQVLGSYSRLLHQDYMGCAEVWMRALNGYVGFFLLAYFFRGARAFRMLLLALIIAGLFPMLMGLYQNVTGAGWREQQTVGLVRTVGLYHDIVTLRFYGFQTIAAIILFRNYFRPSRKIVDYALLAYLVAWGYVIYYCYSKAGVMIAILWFLTWPMLSRRHASLVVGCVLGLILVAVPLTRGSMSDLQQLFSKEIAIGSGENQDARRILGGRGYIWDNFIRDWQRSPATSKLAGEGEMRAVHNEFLRVLHMSGIVGLCCYAIAIGTVAWMLGRRAIGNRSPLHIVALMVFEMYLVDCLGVHPGWYPSYQWFVWGIIGMSLSAEHAWRPQMYPCVLSRNAAPLRGTYATRVL
jgi:cytochrome c oxidase subunit IV